jgi:hypothetical protein
MTVTLGGTTFDHHHYDDRGDVLYLGVGAPSEPARTIATPEGHAVDFYEDDQVIGMVLVNVRWLLDRDGELTITWPAGHVTADELADVLQPAA